MSIVAHRWAIALGQLGYDVVTLAGEGKADRIVGGLRIDATEPPNHRDLEKALADADLVVVENLCTIPLNLTASRALRDALVGRAAIMHHHDPPWQRRRFAHISELPYKHDSWKHVCINDMTTKQMRSRGFEAVTIYNPFMTDEPAGNRCATRAGLGVAPTQILAAHPVRAVPRKNIPLAIRLAEELGAIYWLLGPAEENYDDQLE